MGVPMARRLQDAGHKVTVWRRGTGVPVEEAVAGASVVITMLRDGAAAFEVLKRALPGLSAGATVVEMSTIGPEAVHALRQLLPSEVKLVDAPVLGSVAPAEAGTLTVLAGGSVDGVREVLEVFGTVRECGPLGSGAALKVAVMSAIVPAQVLLAETFAYGEAHGVPRAVLHEVLSGTPLGAAIREPSAETRYALGLAAKDVRLAAWEGSTLAAAALARLEEAEAAGLGDRDLTAIAAHIRPARVQAVNPPTVPATNGMYSHAVRHGNTLYVSGQVALDEHGQVIGAGDMAAQSEAVFDALGKILASQGATFADVTFIRTHLTDMDQILAYGGVRRRYITGTPPASTTVEVPRLFRPGLMIEVDVIAAL